jgi:hypothetical protein
MGGGDRKPAKEISEMLLEITGTALLENDFDRFSNRFYIPHFIATAENKTVLETRQDLRELFNTAVAGYSRQRITNLARFCEVAEYRSDTRIEAMHITHLMSGNQRVAEPFPSFSVLEFIDARWQITSSQYALDKTTMFGNAIRLHQAAKSKQ